MSKKKIVKSPLRYPGGKSRALKKNYSIDTKRLQRI